MFKLRDRVIIKIPVFDTHFYMLCHGRTATIARINTHGDIFITTLNGDNPPVFSSNRFRLVARKMIK